MNWRSILPFSVVVAFGALLAITIDYRAYLLIVGLLCVAWIVCPALTWVGFVNSCRHGRRNLSGPAPARSRVDPGNLSDRAERGTRSAPIRLGGPRSPSRAARTTAQKCARPEPDLPVHP